MAAPNVASNATSSDEFQKLNELVARSDELIAEAEAWARGTKNNKDIGTGNYEEDTNVTVANFASKKAHLYIKVNDTYVALDSSATFDSSETYYGLSAGSDNNAKYYAEQAEEAKSAIEDLTVSSTTLAAGASASATKTIDQQTGIVNIEFGIPQGIQGIPGQDGVDGERGPSTVWIGTTAPSDPDYTVWLNPEGTATPLLVTADQVSYASSATYSANTIGYAMASVEGNMDYINTVASEAEAAAQRAETAAEELEQAITEINGKITNPALPTTTGFLQVTTIHPIDPSQPAYGSYQWLSQLSYNNNLQSSTLPKINNRTLQGNLTLAELGIAPRTGSTVYYTFPSTGIPSTDLANAVNSSLNLADSAVQTIKMNNLDFEPSDGVVNLGTILTADDNANVNKNYLDNPWFTINQREITSYNGTSSHPALAGTYLLDRWKVIEDEGLGNRAISLVDDYLYITAAAVYDATKSFGIGQVIDDDVWKVLGGRKITASINFSVDNTSYITEFFNFTCPNYNTITINPEKYQIINGSGWGLQVKSDLMNNKRYLIFEIIWAGNAWGDVMQDGPLYVKKVKLELGIISTLDLEGAPVYGDELEKCQRYFRYYGGKTSEDSEIIILGSGIAPTTTEIDWNIILNHAMVANPSIESSVDLVAKCGFSTTSASSGTISSSALTSADFFEGINGLYIQTEATGLVANIPYYVFLPATATVSEGDETIAYFALSAEP